MLYRILGTLFRCIRALPVQCPCHQCAQFRRAEWLVEQCESLGADQFRRLGAAIRRNHHAGNVKAVLVPQPDQDFKPGFPGTQMIISKDDIWDKADVIAVIIQQDFLGLRA